MKTPILGSNISVLPSYEAAFQEVLRYLREENPPAYITVNNVHTVVEWLYRLIQEPRRLWKRYLVTNTLFIIYVALEKLGVKDC